MKLSCSIFLMLLLSISISAQESETPKNDLREIRKNKYQIELGLNSIRQIWTNTTGASLIFKKKYTKGKFIELNNIRMLRAYFTLNTQINFTDDPSLKEIDSTATQYHPADEIQFSLGFGFEKQVRNKSFVHYYGNDFFGEFIKLDDDYTANFILSNVNLNLTGTTDRYVQSLRAGINPFIGFKYYITNQFSVGIETGLQLYYFRTKFTELRLEQIVNANGQFELELTELPPSTSNGIGARFNGVRFLTLGYSF